MLKSCSWWNWTYHDFRLAAPNACRWNRPTSRLMESFVMCLGRRVGYPPLSSAPWLAGKSPNLNSTGIWMGKYRKSSMNRRFSIAMLEYQRASIILTASSGHLEAQNVATSDLPRYVQFRDVHGKCFWGNCLVKITNSLPLISYTGIPWNVFPLGKWQSFSHHPPLMISTHEGFTT